MCAEGYNDGHTFAAVRAAVPKEGFAMEDVVLTSGVRTAIGTFNGSLANTPASELGSTVIAEAVSRAGVDPGEVDQIIMGIVGQVAEDAYLSRVSGIKAGIPVETPAFNINRLCGSGLEAINTAARYIETGDADVVVAGGAENMTRLPFYLRKARNGYRLGHDEIQDGIVKLLSDPFEDTHMGITAEKLAEEYEISRTAQDEFASESQRRAMNAIEQGYFKDQIVPITVRERREERIFDTDEFPRMSTPDQLAKLRPAFKKDGMVTPGNASGINDGAAATVVMSATKAEALGVKPRMRLVARAEAGVDPSIMGSGPIPAVHKVLEKGGHVARPDGRDRAERGLRECRLRLLERAFARPAQDQPERRRHRPRPPRGRDRHHPDGEADARAGAHGRPLRPCQPLHRRRPGHRHHLRAPRLGERRGADFSARLLRAREARR